MKFSFDLSTFDDLQSSEDSSVTSLESRSWFGNQSVPSLNEDDSDSEVSLNGSTDDSIDSLEHYMSYHAPDDSENYNDESIGGESLDLPSVHKILCDGLIILGYTAKQQAGLHVKTKFRYFRSGYGLYPLTVQKVLRDVSMKYPDVSPSKMLNTCFLTYNWIKSNDTEPVLAGRHKICEKTVRKRCKAFAALIASLYDDIIKLDGFHGEILSVSLDGVHYPTTEFSNDPDAKYYDHKSHSSGVKYEIGVAIRSPRIVWTNGPFPASYHDISVFRGGKADKSPSQWSQKSLYHQLPDGMKCVADSGYGGEPEKIVVKKAEHLPALQNFIKHALSRHEWVNKRTKDFHIMSCRFRHGKSTEKKMDLHQTVFRAIIVTVQLEFEEYPPFDV